MWLCSVIFLYSLTWSLKTAVQKAVSNPVYSLRDLAASAVVVLTPLDATNTFLKELLSQLNAATGSRLSSNELHGVCLCLDKVLATRSVS
jgi:hypothetical protein